ncbi:hypothetical protein FOL47_005717 [Perkinsus chesapeaki]|uniref:AP-1 complex subunit gamma n=1 Tax=Perkinsus chesapeaki TaxID=330153 RepID=A0A7J6LVZ8_PERCH|nr:hypothetical protein FOL47_005717 [Perkinsus chesapeaki]
MTKLRELIRQVRACKTQSEEKAVVARECAAIRQSFKDGDPDHRSRNVAKLVYIHMLGYPTHFGQMDCLKLIASPKFSEKRVGYLGLTQLLDENSELLMLVTNSIKNDLNSQNQYVTGLALCALANIGSTEMCMSLSREVEQLLVGPGSSNPYIQKKAALCALRIVKKVNELEDKFSSRVGPLIEGACGGAAGSRAGTTGSHGVLLSALSLMGYLLQTDPSIYRAELAYVMPTLLKQLRSLTISGYGNSQEYDVGGITDPFLQVKILKTLRLLIDLNQPLPEEVSDVLAQVATNTEGAKNAGNAVLYECVRTIVYVGPVADPSLRVLGVNILGRFLTHKDNNVKYVALEALKSVVSVDIGAVQKQRSVILSCLTDPDISLRRRALDVAYSLISEDNVKQMTNEFLNYLIVTDAEFREDLITCICSMAKKYAPSRRWQIDTLIKVMVLGGSSVPDSVISSVCNSIASTPQLYNYAVHKLYFTLLETLGSSKLHRLAMKSSDALVETAVWAIGEYGDLLVNGEGAVGVDGQRIVITNDDVINLIEYITNKASSSMSCDIGSIGVVRTGVVKSDSGANGERGSAVVCQYILSCVMKLLSRLDLNQSQKDKLKSLLSQFTSSLSVELQQRACEYTSLLSLASFDQRSDLTDKVPAFAGDETSKGLPIGDTTVDEVPTVTSLPAETAPSEEFYDTSAVDVGDATSGDLMADLGSFNDKTTADNMPYSTTTAPPKQSGNLLDDLDSILGMPTVSQPQPAAPTVTAAPPPPPVQPVKSDPFSNLGLGALGFTMGPSTGTSKPARAAVPQSTGSPDFMSSFNPMPAAQSRTVTVYSNADVRVDFAVSPTNNGVDISASFNAQKILNDFILEAAVPKYLKLSLQPASSPTVQPGIPVTQKLTVTQSSEPPKPIMMKLRIKYVVDGMPVEELTTVNNIPNA